MAQDSLREPVREAWSGLDAADPATSEAASRRIAGLFAAVPLQPGVTAAVTQALAGLAMPGADGAGPVAVRSSATVEDLAGASSAGQYDSYLNVRGADGVTAAVRRCWASLWTPRAIACRARHGLPAAGVGPAVVSMAVVVAQRRAAVLTDTEAARLARTGLAIENLFGQPVDVEWARADGALFVVQARPVTGWAAGPGGPVPAGEEWNDSVGGDWLWTATNLGEAIPDVMTPATWSFVELFMTRVVAPPHVPGYRGFGRVGGRFYVNLSITLALAGVAGVSAKRYLALTELVFGKLPPGVQVPRARVPRRTVLPAMIRVTVANTRRTRAATRRMPEFLAGTPDRCDRLRATIAAAGDPVALGAVWRDQVEPLYLEAAEAFAASGAGSNGLVLVSVPRRLAALAGRDDAAVLLSGQQDGGAEMASLGLALGLARLARGEIGRAEFTRRYGHRGPHEVEMSVPRPAEDPGWIDRQLALVSGAPQAADALLARQQEARAAAWQRLAQRRPKKVARARTMAGRWSAAARAREATRNELVRVMWVLRAWVLRAGELTGHGDGMFFLGWPEILAVLGGDGGPLAAVPARREAYRIYRALPPYPALIRGRFEPVRWAADPHRRTDYYDEREAGQPEAAPSAGTITGFAGAAGVVEGVARVLATAEDASQLGDDEILVTTMTNVGWTPVFPRAAAVVTDVGAPLSHAAIVARELGIPAVVGCGDATMRLHTGDRIRVDGGQGTVQVLQRA